MFCASVKQNMAAVHVLNSSSSKFQGPSNYGNCLPHCTFCISANISIGSWIQRCSIWSAVSFRGTQGIPPLYMARSNCHQGSDSWAQGSLFQL